MLIVTSLCDGNFSRQLLNENSLVFLSVCLSDPCPVLVAVVAAVTEEEGGDVCLQEVTRTVRSTPHTETACADHLSVSPATPCLPLSKTP